MKSISKIAGPIVLTFAMTALTACATGTSGTQQSSASGASSSTAPGTMMGRPGAGQAGMMDQQSMCAMYGNMMGSRTPEERQAIMDEHMKGMSPEMRQQRLQMMQQQCR